ncbi:MAG: transketolase family protein [Candidatus Omnitrophica bacterium]|nr:transketolase family protein [Candidatus Omnitrophota bacterium]MDD5770733.1 transketolase family protein [Candidatus Omnitrophota bacterium]
MAEQIYQRDVYGQELAKLGALDKNIVVLDADLSSSTRTNLFARQFPDRFFNFGVAEQNMMATAAGLASCGKKVFLSTFAVFAAGRAWDQIRVSISYNNFDVKIVATHAGITVGPDGASHQALEDIALMRVLPDMNIIVPCDGPQTAEVIRAAAAKPGPFYIRLGRSKVPTIDNKGEFEFGRAQLISEGNDVTIVACGIMVYEAISAVRSLAQKGIKARLLNMHTIWPLDSASILKAAAETRFFVVCEEHNVFGGLASSINDIIAEHCPRKVIRIGIRNRFGQSGEPADLLKEYNLTSLDIEKAVLSNIS